ncbi:MAG: hypothetical protein ACT4NX_02415 [Deltaproteobacteria bacterium]
MKPNSPSAGFIARLNIENNSMRRYNQMLNENRDKIQDLKKRLAVLRDFL